MKMISKSLRLVGLLLVSSTCAFLPLRHNILTRSEPSLATVLAANSKASSLTDWVIEGLEVGESITSSSASKAGENDTLPPEGLCIDKVRILASDSLFHDEDDKHYQIRLLVGRNGWGTGVHPSTRLCLEWLCREGIVRGGEVLLDYGCGSGILSIAALHMGASKTIGVDIEAEALVTTERNIAINGFEDRFEGLHTREVVPFCLCRPHGADLCVANILIGQLVRSSMVSAILSNVAPGGLICFSGIRPWEVESLKAAYDNHLEWIDTQYAELSADETEGSVESYGFDVGRWSRVVGRLKENCGMDLETMSELAVS